VQSDERNLRQSRAQPLESAFEGGLSSKERNRRKKAKAFTQRRRAAKAPQRKALRVLCGFAALREAFFGSGSFGLGRCAFLLIPSHLFRCRLLRAIKKTRHLHDARVQVAL